MSSKLFYQIALTQIKGVGDVIARSLLEIFQDEEAVFKTNKKTLSSIKGLPSKLINEILDPEVLNRAETELAFIEKNKIDTYFINSETYPLRLKECVDAPVLLYFKGNVDFNKTKVIGIVGTRKSTDYGQTFCDKFLEEVSISYPDTLIISGLAYGIDIHAHRASLKYNLPTIGILAHGLDRIYPAVHRKTAVDMLNSGGLLTEFVSETEPDKFNFVRRNRIIAGMSDAVIVVESDIKGGSLITADIANSYNRDVFAVPGRVTDPLSQGCNKLINDNKAAIFESPSAFFQAMGWDKGKTSSKPAQKSLFIELTEEEQAIYDLLSKSETVHVNDLSKETHIPVSSLFFNLLEMEMKGLIKPLPGSLYKLID